MTPLDYLQQPQTLRLALGELTPQELHLAQATVLFVLDQLVRGFQRLPAERTRYDYAVNAHCELDPYDMGHLDGWNACLREWGRIAAAQPSPPLAAGGAG